MDRLQYVNLLMNYQAELLKEQRQRELQHLGQFSRYDEATPNLEALRKRIEAQLDRLEQLVEHNEAVITELSKPAEAGGVA